MLFISFIFNVYSLSQKSKNSLHLETIIKYIVVFHSYFSQIMLCLFMCSLFMCIITGRTTKLTMTSFYECTPQFLSHQSRSWFLLAHFWFRAGAGFTHSSLNHRINWSCGVYCGTTNITFVIETLSVNVLLLKRFN